jgi:hypothetical protein
MAVFIMRDAVLNGVDQVEATRKLVGGNRANIGVTIKVELNPEEMLEQISIRTSLKWRAET